MPFFGYHAFLLALSLADPQRWISQFHKNLWPDPYFFLMMTSSNISPCFFASKSYTSREFFGWWWYCNSIAIFSALDFLHYKVGELGNLARFHVTKASTNSTLGNENSKELRGYDNRILHSSCSFPRVLPHPPLTCLYCRLMRLRSGFGRRSCCFSSPRSTQPCANSSSDWLFELVQKYVTGWLSRNEWACQHGSSSIILCSSSQVSGTRSFNAWWVVSSIWSWGAQTSTIGTTSRATTNPEGSLSGWYRKGSIDSQFNQLEVSTLESFMSSVCKTNRCIGKIVNANLTKHL